MMSFSVSRATLVFLLFTAFSTRGQEATEGECEANGSCNAKIEPKCGIPKLPLSRNIYRFGGSAQAYKSNQPEKNEVCHGYENTRNRVATWPFWLSARKNAPKLNLTLTLWSCEPSDAPVKSSWFTQPEEFTCCNPLSLNDAGTVVEVWQARPGGGYSSLLSGEEDGDCRAKQSFHPDLPSVSFKTVAPGSTGSLAGLGPSGWDTAPYGPPVVHILITGPRHSPMLINLPVLMESKTLKARNFWWPDWRGAAWVNRAERNKPYNISSWTADKSKNLVNIEVDVFLQRSNDQVRKVSEHLCRSWVYGLPHSFFLEPISVCAPYMLDFFDL